MQHIILNNKICSSNLFNNWNRKTNGSHFNSFIQNVFHWVQKRISSCNFSNFWTMKKILVKFILRIFVSLNRNWNVYKMNDLTINFHLHYFQISLACICAISSWITFSDVLFIKFEASAIQEWVNLSTATNDLKFTWQDSNPTASKPEIWKLEKDHILATFHWDVNK